VTEMHQRRVAWPRADDAEPAEGPPEGRAGLLLVPGTGRASLEEVAERAARAGLRRIEVLAWRDLDDPEAGGSERHAHHVASLWAGAGIDVTMRTSAAAARAPDAERAGYHVRRRGQRYSVFPRSAARGLLRTRGRPDGLVEIWNGMPFFSPLWARCPRVAFLHHVHAEMWQMVLSPGRARLGQLVERRLAPPFYRGTRVVTLSESSRREIVDMLHLRPERVSVVQPGIAPSFSPGPGRSPAPYVLAVGRLVPVKRFELLVDALALARRSVPDLRAVIVGEGYERDRLEAHRRAVGAERWLALPGFMDEEQLVDQYRRAWLVASTSQREGWGMTITEAGACATPAVVSRIAGHVDAVEDDVTGFVVDLDRHSLPGGRADAVRAFADALVRVLGDPVLRARMGRAAQARAQRLSWEATAAGTLDALVDEALARAPRRRAAT